MVGRAVERTDRRYVPGRRLVHPPRELGRDHVLVAMALDRPADELLVGQRAVELRCVEEVDPQLERALNRRLGLGLVRLTRKTPTSPCIRARGPTPRAIRACASAFLLSRLIAVDVPGALGRERAPVTLTDSRSWVYDHVRCGGQCRAIDRICCSVRCDQRASHAPDAPRGGMAESAASVEPRRVLLVEDDDGDAMIVSDLLVEAWPVAADRPRERLGEAERRLGADRLRAARPRAPRRARARGGAAACARPTPRCRSSS